MATVTYTSMRSTYQRRRPAPARLNHSVRRTYDLVRSSLHLLGPEDRLVEGELTDATLATRSTVRAALQLLAQEGLLIRGPKVGTTAVGSMVLPVGELLTLRDQGSVYGTDTKVIETTVMPAPAIVGKRLELPPGARVALSEILLLQDGTPLALTSSYVGLREEHLVEPDGIALDTIELLEQSLTVPLGDSETTVAAVASDAETASLLDIHEGAPVLWCEDLLCDVDGRPRALMQLRYRGDRVVFSATARVRRHVSGSVCDVP
jgi:GntR family transcriptional regulator